MNRNISGHGYRKNGSTRHAETLALLRIRWHGEYSTPSRLRCVVNEWPVAYCLSDASTE